MCLAKNGLILKQPFYSRFLSQPDSKEYKYYQTKLKEIKAEQSSTSQTSTATSSTQESGLLNFDFAATLAQVRAKAAASLSGESSATPSMSSQEMREREKQIQEQKEVRSIVNPKPKWTCLACYFFTVISLYFTVTP
jgi:hypothetical protein